MTASIKKTGQKFEKSSEAINKLQEELQNLKNQLARALADYRNLEKRAEAERDNRIKMAVAGILLGILPVLDTLKIAYSALGASGQNLPPGKGIELSIKQFEGALATVGVVAIPAMGAAFDPEIMDCVEVQNGEPNNQVAAEVLTGYLYHDRVLRPAKVKVYKTEINQAADARAAEGAETGDGA